MQRIILAKTAGFCFGVDRAVNMAYEAAGKYDRCCSLGPVIHNTDVTRDLEAKGVRIVADPSEIREGECVIIRAHGISPDVYRSIENAGGKICDATCPFVEKIHSIVSENSGPESVILIAGNPSHPEVEGIKGSCTGESFVFSSYEELEKLLAGSSELCRKRIIMVSQTTFSEKEWKKSKEILNFYCTNIKIFDTICSATRKRQEEAAELSEKCDAVIVIGGRHSSNTEKLYELCRENCDTFLVERAEELKNIDLSTYAAVGVTAGASTPSVIIKEVLSAMSENIKETENIQVEEVPSVATSVDSDNLDALLDETLKDDSVIKCTVERITATEIQVDIPKNHILGGLTGLVPFDEYSYDITADPAKELNVGDIINLVIMKKNDAEGTVLLSKKRADKQKSWVDIIDAKEDGRILDGTVIDVIKGGVLVASKGSTVFVPASLATERRGDSLDELVKKNVKFKIIDVDPHRQRAVGSIRAANDEVKAAAAEAFWASAEEGKTYSGVVKSLTNYGAFVDIGGIDGMVHISEMSWRRIKHPSEVFSIGQEVEVFIKALDKENKKISLGYRKDEDNPWAILKKTYEVGSVIEAEIVGITDFGIFAKVIPGIDGLIHISQISNRRIEKEEIASLFTPGQKVTCKITAIDYDKKRVSLSTRALEEPVEEAEEAAEEAAEAVEETAEAAEEVAQAAEETVEAAAEEAVEAVEETAEAVEETAEAAAEEAVEAVEETAEAVAEEAVEEVAEAAEETAE